MAHIDNASPDIVVFAGDLCLFGPRPAECIDLLRGRETTAVYGNSDEWVLTPPVPPGTGNEKEQRHRQHLYEISVWTQAALGEGDRHWLAGLPFERRISPTSDPKDDLLVVHANPRDVSQVIFPTPGKQEELFGRVTNEQSDEELAPLLEGTKASILAFGHLHVPNVRIWGAMTLANISSVSLAGDGDWRAKYGLLNWNRAGGWSVEQQYISYDLQAELDALASAQPPRWQSYVRRLEATGA